MITEKNDNIKMKMGKNDDIKMILEKNLLRKIFGSVDKI